MNKLDALPPEHVLTELMQGRRPRLLIVDDQALFLQSMQALFGEAYEVIVTERGEDVLGMAARLQPDLILLDQVMPSISGQEVCRLLKADPQTQDIPVIFLTALNDPESEAHCFELGAMDFIAKPFHSEVVRARVRTHLMLKYQGDLLRSWVFVDGLTGSANRRHFDERLKAEWGRAERSGKPLSVLMLDVDNFKDFNDRFGHQAGDDCLRLVARAIAAGMRRPADLTARYGGEEFACLLPDTDEAGAMVLAEALRLAVPVAVSAGVQINPDWPRVTVCIGVGTTRPGIVRSPEDMLREADHNLYRAKKAGRDCVRQGVFK